MSKSMQSLVLGALANASSSLPQSFSGLVDSVIELQPATTNDEIADALETLVDISQVRVSRALRGGIWQNLYWPIGLTQPEKPMSRSETLLRAIVLDGPIVGSALAEKTGMPAKSIDAILASPNTRNVVVTRVGFCAEKGRELKHYMTTTQADDWDENVAAAGGDRDGTAATDEAAAHVMSAPPVSETSTESDELEEARRTIETLRDNIAGMLSDWTDIRQALDVSTHEEALRAIALKDEWITQRDREIHDLKNDVAGANMVLKNLAEKLCVGRFEDIPSAFDELTRALSTRVVQSRRMALLLIDSADLTEVEELDEYDAPNAQQLAMRSIEQGHAARALVVQILGEAKRLIEWKEAA